MDPFYYPDMPPPLAPGQAAAASLVGKEEKTVPFLRSLTEMLLNNHDLISFVPGERSNGKTKTPGKIIVHDRNRVQSQVLPFYFNHASFASLRRQLSYFSFVRNGKGRQAGSVTYVNENVVELGDILKLKRRAVGENAPSSAGKAQKQASGQQAERLDKGEGKQSGDQPQEPSRDVASAVLSGRMHACETNHDLDANKYHHSLSVATSKSISAITLGTKSRAALSSSKTLRKKKRSAKYKRTRKGGPRVNRLLKVNTIVPFIHLPVRLFKAKSLQESMRKDECQQLSSASTERKKSRSRRKSSGNTSGSNSSGKEENGYRERANKKARKSGSKSSGNEEIRYGGGTASAPSLSESYFKTSRQGSERNAASESVVSALLALGAGQR
jgi:hypothetical protein